MTEVLSEFGKTPEADVAQAATCDSEVLRFLGGDLTASNYLISLGTCNSEDEAA